MKKVIATAIVVAAMSLSIMACNSPEVSDTSINYNETAITESTESKSVPISESKEMDPYSSLDIFIDNYNSTSDYPITDISELDIQGIDYRTEYRLNAFKNAVGYKGTVNENEIHIVNYGNFSNESIRLYMTADSIDKVIDVYEKSICILDDTIADNDIKDGYGSLDTTGSANFYLGKSGYISGYINCIYADGGISGYELMIDCSKLNFID